MVKKSLGIALILSGNFLILLVFEAFLVLFLGNTAWGFVLGKFQLSDKILINYNTYGFTFYGNPQVFLIFVVFFISFVFLLFGIKVLRDK